MYSYVVPVSAASTNNDTADNDNSTVNDTTSDDIGNNGTTTTNETGNETINNSTAATDDPTVNPNNEDNGDQDRNDNRGRYTHMNYCMQVMHMYIATFRSDNYSYIW